MENIEEVANHARRAAALLSGASALLQRKDYVTSGTNDGGDALRELVTEAQAELAGVIDNLEGELAHVHEKLRAERAHREQQAKICAAIVTSTPGSGR